LSAVRQIGSLGEVLLDQAIGECCVDRLSWHDLSGAGLHLPVLVPHGHQLAVIVEMEKLLRGVSLLSIAERAIKIVRGADQCKVCEGLRKIAKCLALRAGLFREQPEVIGVSQHALEEQAGLI
jgi:hypothetical protein